MLCINKYDRWPITDIRVVDYLDINKYPEYQSTYLSSNKSLIFTTESNNLPIALLILTEGSPWILQSEIDTTQNRLYTKLRDRHKAEGCRTSIDDKIYDPRYRYIEGENEFNLLKENGILDLLRTNNQEVSTPANTFQDNHKLQENATYYSNIVYSDENLHYLTDYSHNLYQMSYVKWKLEWESFDLNRDTIYQSIEEISIPLWWQSTFNLVWLVNMLLTGFFFGIVNWVKALYQLIFNPPIKNTITVVWDNISDTIAIIFCFVKWAFVYIYEWIS